MAKLLFIDTSTKNCSVVLSENQNILVKQEELETMDHAKVLHNLIQECFTSTSLSMQDIDAVVVAGGPGSYTGLRIGMSAAKGLCFALDKPMIVLDSLVCYAQAMIQKVQDVKATYIASLNSRKGEIYYAVLNGNGKIIEASTPAVVADIDWDKYKINNMYIAGNTGIKLNDIILNLNAKKINLDFLAENYVSQGFERFGNKDFDNLIYKEPNYLKPFQ